MLRKALKFLHSVGASGMIGALACYYLLLVFAPRETAAEYAAMRQSIAAICNYLLLPSMAVTIISGILAIAFHKPFMGLKWVWLKAAFGIVVFEGTLGLIGARADYAATLSKRLADGSATIAEIDAAVASEWGVIALLMFLALANTLVGVWRPSLNWSPAAPSSRRKDG